MNEKAVLTENLKNDENGSDKLSSIGTSPSPAEFQCMLNIIIKQHITQCLFIVFLLHCALNQHCVCRIVHYIIQ